MTSEELNRAIEFLTQQAAQFWAGMEELKQSHRDFKEQTARFESWAAEVVAIQSRRLDQNDELIEKNKQQIQQDEKRFERQLEEQRRENKEILKRIDFLLARIDFIIARLFPSNN